MQNRLKYLYEEYMTEKNSDHAHSPEHQHYMKNLAMEMAAVEYLMTSDIEKHIGKVHHHSTTDKMIENLKSSNPVKYQQVMAALHET